MITTIIWIDSNITEGQTSEIVEPAIITTVGMVVKDCKEYVTIARDEIDGEWRGQISIPRECIRDIRETL